MAEAAAGIELLLACARVRLREADRRRLGAALPRVRDWGEVLRLAAWHGLRPLLDRHLAAMDGALVPQPARVELWSEAEQVRRRNEQLARELAELDAAFGERGLRCVHYKGPTLALAAYGDPGLREFGDLDILMDRGDVFAARDLLVERGYRQVDRLPPALEAQLARSHAHYHIGLRSPDGRVVELHWRTDPEFPVEATGSDRWWDAAARMAVAGREVRCLRPEELTLVLCIHGAKHHWTSLGWLVDVAELLRAEACGDWAAIAGRARALGCARRVGVGLALARDVLDAPLPPEAADLVALDGVQPLARRFARNLAALEPSEPGSWEALRLNLALHERTGRRARLVLDAVFLPTMADWQRWRLPRALFFAYPALRLTRLAAKYARRARPRLAAPRRLHM